MATREAKAQLHIVQPETLRVGIVCAQFNSAITHAQLQSATQFLDEQKIHHDLVEVAGCYELPFVLQGMARTQKYSALVALGCLIKGETIHFEIIAEQAAQGIMRISLDEHIPIGFGVITANTTEQALARTVIGHDAAYAAVQSAFYEQQLQKK